MKVSVCDGQKSQDDVHRHNLCREKRSEADSNRGPSAYQPGLAGLCASVDYRVLNKGNTERTNSSKVEVYV